MIVTFWSGCDPNDAIVGHGQSDRLRHRQPRRRDAQHLGHFRLIDRLAPPDNSHRPPLARRSRTPDAVAVAHIERPGQAGALHVATPTQTQGSIGRLIRRRKECFWIMTSANATCTPCVVMPAFSERLDQSRITPSCRHFMWPRCARSGHYPPPPRVPTNAANNPRSDDLWMGAGVVFYRTFARHDKGVVASLPKHHLYMRLKQR